MIEETVEVVIAHESNPQHRRQSGEAPAACKPSFVDHNEQISDEGNPDLDLDGVGALTIKVFQREVLLQLLEEQLDLPSPPIDLHDFLRVHLHVVGEQGDEFHAFLDISIDDDSGAVDDGVFLLYLHSKCFCPP